MRSEIITPGVTIYEGDCLEVMPTLEAGSVDLVLCDPPYGTTACKWDSVIPFAPMWEQLRRLVKPKAAMVFSCSQPFASALVMSNAKSFRYECVWDKRIPSGMSYARYQPMRQHENIYVFSLAPPVYNPQKQARLAPIKEGGKKRSESAPIQNFAPMGGKIYATKNPTTLISFSKVRRGSLHPTQKPVDLLEYLIKTHSNEGDLVLDFTMGSGSTGEAALKTGRRFIGIEKPPEDPNEKNYYPVARQRLIDYAARWNFQPTEAAPAPVSGLFGDFS